MWLLNKCGRDLRCVLLFFLLKNKKPWALVVTWGLPYLFVGFLNALKVDFLGRWGWAQFPKSLNRGMTELRWDKPDTCLCRFSVWVWLVSRAQKASFHLLTEHNICLDQKIGRLIALRQRVSLSGTSPSPATNGNQGDEAEQRGLKRKGCAGEEHECRLCHSGARKQRGKGKLNAVWPGCGQRCPFPVGDSRKTVRAENQDQRALALSLEDGILVTDLSRRTFPTVHLLEWNPTVNIFLNLFIRKVILGKLGR